MVRSFERGPVVELDKVREELYLGQWIFASSPSSEELLEILRTVEQRVTSVGLRLRHFARVLIRVQELKCTMPSCIRRLCFYVEIVGRGGISEMQHALRGYYNMGY